MYGVCQSYNDFGGGGGYYVGNVCRCLRWWWDGKKWSEQPVQTGPFAGRADAEKFAADAKRSGGLGSFFVYGPDDPFGERPEGLGDQA